MYERSNIHEGMTVRSKDGDKLGRIYAVGDSEFQIEKGLFFPKDYVVRYSDISDIRDDEVILAYGRASLLDVNSWSATRSGLTTEDIRASRARTSAEGIGPGQARRVEEGEQRIPVVEEQLEVTKREREAGAVSVRKDVVEEREKISVPVRKERVTVERVATSGEPARGEAAFREEEVVVPVREEEVEVRKRPVQTGEVRVHKQAYEEARRVADTVRKEKVQVEEEGEVRATDTSDESARRAGVPSEDKEPPRGMPKDDPKRRY